MMTFTRYALKTFLWNFCVLWISFTSMLQIVDLLNNSDEVLDRHPRDVGAVMEYAIWRLPELAVFLIPFSVLMAALLSLAKFERSNETLALKSAGAYDLVICREVLEHLTVLEVTRAVANMVRLSSRFIYVTTRFHPNPADLLDFNQKDDLDPSHITLLNKDMLRLMFVLEGCRSRPDLEARMDWGNKGRVLVLEKA